MTFLQIINLIKETALAQPNVNTFVRNFLDLNREDTVYSAVVLQDRDGLRDRISEQDWNTYTFHLGYVDRLTFDESNRDDIFSTGINIINNIVASIRDTWFPDIEVNIIDRFQTFDQRFTASCAGVYVVLSIQVPVSDCVDGEQTDLYDKYEAKITENGHYHFVPDGRPVDEIDITIDVDSAKPEERLVEIISSNGSYHYDPTAGSVFSEADITVSVPIKEEVTLAETITSNGSYHYNPAAGSVFSEADITVSVPETVLEEYQSSFDVSPSSGNILLDPSDIDADGFSYVAIDMAVMTTGIFKTLTSNGVYHYKAGDQEVGDAYIDTVDVTIDVHPSVSLSERYTSNGVYAIDGEFDGGEVMVDVHPSVSLTRTFTSNDTYSIYGEWKDAEITVAVSAAKPEETLTEIITSNGSYHYEPSAGSVFSEADITVDCPGPKEEQSLVEEISENGHFEWHPDPGKVFSDTEIFVDVHPSVSLSETYASNGVYSISGEFNGGSVTVSVPSDQKPEERLVETIRSNGNYNYDPTPGSVYNSVAIGVDVHPSMSLVQTISSNGVTSLSGEWKDASITVDVHPSVSLSETYTTNGTKTISGEFNGGTVNVDVHPSVSLSETYTSNGTYNISGEYNGGVVTVAVSAAKPEESLVETISSNGSYHYDPSAGSVFSGVDITVSCPEPKPEMVGSLTVSENGTGTLYPGIGGVFNMVNYSVEVHPSMSLVQTISSNGVTSLSGEWKDAEITVDVHPSTSLSVTYISNGVYNETGEWTNATIAVSVPERKPEESLIQTISANGSYSFSPTPGSVFSDASIVVDVHPSNSLSKTYTTNGTKTITGEFNGGTVTISVHPSTSLTETITSNGSYHYNGDYAGADITVAVDRYANTLRISQTAYNKLSVKDPDTIYLIYY